MAVGEFAWPQMHPVSGIQWGVAEAGIKYKNKKDIALMAIDANASVAGVFTQNAFCAAPVSVCREHLNYANAQNTWPRFFIINSGNANACTGEEGFQAALSTCSAIAKIANIKKEQVLPFSTGVIGERLPEDKINAALPSALNSISAGAWLNAAQAIMTTDTRPKGASKVVDIQGENITITGIAKGAGMIKPNMATMLAFIATDAAISPEILNTICKDAADSSFNRITIDGDTSTNDSCMLVATGQSSAPKIERGSETHYENVRSAIIDVFQSLAKQIVLDGEGATKCVEIEVAGGHNRAECLQVAYAVGHSPLVKTALFASDPNWGRIVAAVGYAGIEDLNDKVVKVWLDDVLIVENGGRAASYREEMGQAVFNRDCFSIRINLGRGEIAEKIWTSDLSHEYIKINAEYRT